jgi:hypothetical protein
MELPVEFNKGSKIARAVFADQRDFGFLPEWVKSLGDDKNPVRNDAVVFARLTVHRVSAHREVQPYANSIKEIADYIRNNPHDEVAAFVVLKCDWFPDSGIIGICHFRRSWANRIILDYLAAHPFIANRPEGYPHEVRGVGSVLLYFICKIAEQYECDSLWGEATHLSNEYYKKAFKLDSVKDLIYVDRAKIIEYIGRCDKAWAEPSSTTAIQPSAIEELYKLEVHNPPFVGSTTAVFNPPRRLASRFLNLPYHVQIEIAKALNLWEATDEGQRDENLFRSFFRRATDRGILAKLWSEVETHHTDGEPHINPFL